MLLRFTSHTGEFSYVAGEIEIAGIISLILSEAAGKDIMTQMKRKEL